MPDFWSGNRSSGRARGARSRPRPAGSTGRAWRWRSRARRFLELAKQAGFLYRTQNPTEQRRLLDTVLSNCTFDRGSLCPTYNEPFDLFVRGNETGNWRREWDSDSQASFRFCKLQIPHCQGCRRCQRCRRALHRIAPAGGKPDGARSAEIVRVCAMNAGAVAVSNNSMITDETCGGLSPARAQPHR